MYVCMYIHAYKVIHLKQRIADTKYKINISKTLINGQE